jgi:hypothetical protein
VQTIYPFKTNVHQATLVEDAIITSRELKRPFIRVLLDGMTEPSELTDCPLVRMATPYFLYPLLKDDKVYVYSPEDSPESFELYGVAGTIPKEILDSVSLRSGDLVESPSKAETIGFHVISPTLALIVTSEYTILRSGDLITLFKPDVFYQSTTSSGSYSVMTGKFALETADSMKIKAKELNLEATQTSIDLKGLELVSSGGFSIQSNNIALVNIITKLFDFISDLYTKMGTFDLHTHNTVCVFAAGVPAPSLPTTSPTGATAGATEVETYKSTNVSAFFQ